VVAPVVLEGGGNERCGVRAAFYAINSGPTRNLHGHTGMQREAEIFAYSHRHVMQRLHPRMLTCAGIASLQ
jgi:hypothetical protein